MQNENTIQARPEFINAELGSVYTVVEVSLTPLQKLWRNNVFRKSLVLILLAVIWEVYARTLDNELLFPTFVNTVLALVSGIGSGDIVQSAKFSLGLLLQGFIAGVVLAGLLTAFASVSRIGADFLETLTAMFNPLPSIALLPLALIWFGLDNGSVIFVLIHAVVWAVALNTHSGFRGISNTLRMVGQNYGLSRTAYVFKILVPAALPSILTGLKIGWAFSWRTLIAAELVFGASGNSGGLGWFIFVNKNELLIPNVFAGLLTIILLGLFVDNLIFRQLEARTVRR